MDWEAFYNNFRNPDFIPGYEIQNRLGGGAFGEVYKARKHSIGKSYAIKFLKVEEGAQRDTVERELEQVSHFAAIDHPNLVTIEDMDVVQGVPYLIMGYAGEETLGKRMRGKNLSREDALSFFTQTCRGVLALHDRRLVHFDIKPGNVFIHGDVARVGDYGLSKLMTDGRLTLSFGRGTPHYMAPEMLKGRADHRADIYSLGVILYEAIAGKVPFETKSSGSIVMRENDDPPEFSPDFPADLRRVVERCLRIEAHERYPDVAALLEDLGQTARQGDSIRLEHVVASPTPRSVAAQAQVDALSEPDAQGAERPADEQALENVADKAAAFGTARRELTQSATELRSTAAELTRGAVEVARGVWDGLKTAGQGTPNLREPSKGEPPGSDSRVGEDPATPRQGSSWSAAEADGPPTGRAAGADSGAQFSSPARTIPVPPRRGGGPLGALVSTLALAIEVFVSLLRGLFGAARSLSRSFRARVHTERSPGPWRMIRVAIFFLFLATLGGLIMMTLLSIAGVL